MPHHLLDVAEVGAPLNAAALAVRAERAITQLRAGHVPPLVVGGATLHASALVHGLSPIPPPDPAIRSELRERLEREGLGVLRAELVALDPDAATRLDLDNPARVQRALEVVRTTGKPLAFWQAQPRIPPAHRYAVVRLEASRSRLNERIARRAEAMVASGLLRETACHLSQAAALDRVIGYREALDVLLGRAPLASLAERITVATRRYAKRQVTFFKKAFPDAALLPADPAPEPEHLARAVASFG